MKKLLFLLFFTSLAYSQTINFTGCPNLFDSNTYVFNKISTDVYGRNVYQTTPIDGAQDCGGLGVCEFQISWNNSQNRWEFIADDGNGDFSNTYLIYYNTAGATPNPPSLNLGVWLENTGVTSNNCGGSLTSGNSTLTGTVQDSTLGIENLSKNKFLLTSNPIKNSLDVLSPSNESALLYDSQGRFIKKIDIKKGQNNIDVSQLNSGVYILKTQTETLKVIKK